MKKTWIVPGVIVGIVLIFILTCVGKYNTLVSKDEGVKTAWGQVQSVYQRRMDLVPNLVETVKGYAAHESETLLAVTEARTKATQTNINPANAEEFADFQASQQALSSSLSRLLVVVEKYPDLKASTNFLDLQAQLEGTENRISTERMRYNEVVQAYNTFLRQFPNNLIASMFGFQIANVFEAKEGADTAPEVKF